MLLLVSLYFLQKPKIFYTLLMEIGYQHPLPKTPGTISSYLPYCHEIELPNLNIKNYSEEKNVSNQSFSFAISSDRVFLGFRSPQFAWKLVVFSRHSLSVKSLSDFGYDKDRTDYTSSMWREGRFWGGDNSRRFLPWWSMNDRKSLPTDLQDHWTLNEHFKNGKLAFLTTKSLVHFQKMQISIVIFMQMIYENYFKSL